MRTTALLAACLLTAGTGAATAQQEGPLRPPTPLADSISTRNDPSKRSGGGAGDDVPAPIPGLTDKFDRSPAAVESALLGDPFESHVAGLIFRPPVHCKRVNSGEAGHSPDHVVDYTDDDRQWLLRVTRAKPAQPMPLQTVKDPKDRTKDKTGLLEMTVGDVVRLNPQAEVLRQEIINVGEYGVGIAVLRFNLGTQRYLRQQAIFQVNEQLYYVFNLTTPAAKEGPVEANPAEATAVETFKAMMETIQVLDRSWIKTDQVNRLFRTRALFTDWKDKGGRRIKDAVVPQQWLRIVRDGKDIGYTYRFEEFTEGKNVRGNPARAYDGVLIGMRTRTFEGGTQTDAGVQMFTSLDRKHEDWANVMNVVANKGQKDETKKQVNEYGFSEIKLTRVIDRNPSNFNESIGRDVETYKLSVTHPRKEHANKAEYYTPSPWYVPQAIGSMLPRLVPLNRPVTYLFQSYIGGEEHEVVHRYVDVGYEKPVEIDGKTVQAIPVSDRFRLEGTATIHYMSPQGQYLGSVNETNKVKIMLLPVTKEGLEKIWPGEKIWPLKDETNDDLAPPPAGATGR